MAKQLDLLVIVGPTASGKTGLAIEIAKKYHGEIIAADSRTVYKGLDIGTAKPTAVEQRGIPHYGFDLVGPGESFSVGDFKTYADSTIHDIQIRGNTPILVGGTGLYVNAVVYDFSLAPPNDAVRKELEGLGIVELQKRIQAARLQMPENTQNRRHLVRTLEKGDVAINHKPLSPETIIIGINPGKELLRVRITERAHAMLNTGVLDEVAWGLEHYGLDSEAMTGGVYRIYRDVIWGKLTTEQAVDLFVTSDMQLAKRQMAWFKRNQDIQWFDSAEAAYAWFEKEFIGTLK
ncbi:MAG: tRNA (adenosine(37)-N6)-dimethylallyltransferase MiaA [Candidatus Saccharimonadales bacterium]